MKPVMGRNFSMGPGCDLAAWPLMTRFDGGARVLVPAEKGVVFGDNVTLGSMVTVNGGVKAPTRVGDDCFLWHGANIGHDCVLGRGVVVNVNAVLCGEVTVGDDTYIAPGAVVQPRCRIGRNVVIGTLANVIHDTVIPDNEVWYGNPARRRRENRWRKPE